MYTRELRTGAAAMLLLLAGVLLNSGPALGQFSNGNGYGGGAAIPEPQIPPGVDVFNLSLDQTKLYSQSYNFEVVGHSYFKGPWLSPFAQQHGLGAGFNTVRVYNGIAYLAGYNGPPTLFGVLIANVSDPTNMTPLAFVPCTLGTRCVYLRINTNKHIMVGTRIQAAVAHSRRQARYKRVCHSPTFRTLPTRDRLGTLLPRQMALLMGSI